MKHLYGLDILRVASALAVMLFHFAFRGEAAGDLPALEIPEFLKAIASYGYLSVSVFFITSGFVISYSAEDHKPYDFLVSRLVRIYPTFLIIMSLTAATIALSGNPQFHVDAMQYIANLFIFSLILGEPFVDGVYWSIVLEIMFYAWVFLIVTAGQFRHILKILPVWMAISFVNEAFIGSEDMQNLLITEYSGFFSLGIVINRLRQNVTTYGIGLFFMAAAYSLFTAFAGAGWYENAYSVELSRAVIAAIIILSVVIFILLVNLKINRKFWPAAQVLGGATYALYLVHQNIGYIAIAALLDHFPAGAAIVVVSGLLTIFSILFHLVVERRLNSAIKRFLLNVPNRLTKPA
ncbi:hypothetical protein ACO34A_28680 (plasmid) [Rhizobium sp. ACO-34A]|nr:acyltransferase [Rhizobium sp. ACO-34A]ATN37742.1 hypothetical protein ACO34A_28680 [Rhizobium sp. ACO-34A]